MPRRMMTLAEELAGHCLAVVHPLQPRGEGRMKRGRKKESEGGKRRKRETTGKEKPPSFMETGPR